MMIRFLKATLALLVYMGLWMIPIIAWLQMNPDPNPDFILVLMAVIGLSIVFVMDPISKWAFSWNGFGVPASLDEVKMQILSMNRADLPISVEQKGNVYRITWKYLDAKWYEMFQKVGIRESYTLQVKLDPQRHRATFTDIKRSITWGKGIDQLHFGWFGFRGVSMEAEVGKAWGITEQFSLGRIYDYRFTTAEIRNPVLNTLLRMGWDVRYGIF